MLSLSQPLTLNDLINKYTHSNSREHINCGQLFKEVKPKSVIAWADAISQREKNVDWITQHAFDKQKQFGCSYTYQRLYDYLYDLVITKTFVGLSKENKALKELKTLYPSLLLGIDERYDGDYGVDIWVGAVQPVRYMAGGIQVKPISYLSRPAEEKQINETKNQKYKNKFTNVKEIIYLYYNENGTWANMPEVKQYLNNLAAENSNAQQQQHGSN